MRETSIVTRRSSTSKKKNGSDSIETRQHKEEKKRKNPQEKVRNGRKEPRKRRELTRRPTDKQTDARGLCFCKFRLRQAVPPPPGRLCAGVSPSGCTADPALQPCVIKAIASFKSDDPPRPPHLAPSTACCCCCCCCCSWPTLICSVSSTFCLASSFCLR